MRVPSFGKIQILFELVGDGGCDAYIYRYALFYHGSFCCYFYRIDGVKRNT